MGTRPNSAMRSAPRRAGGGAFTMVELLVVLLILAILLGLVVGISRYIMSESARKQTESIQKVVMNAVERYRDATASYPDDSADCISLMTDLLGNAQSKEAIRDVSSEAWGGSGKALKDGFGENMKYQKTGGLGGTPVLISKGADRQDNTSDDVRSDGQ